MNLGPLPITGATLDQIEATQGNEQALYGLFGNYSSIDNSNGSSYVTFYYQNNTINYDYQMNWVVSIAIKSSTWPVVIKGRSIRVGDSIQDLKAKFGANFEVITPEYGSDKFSRFNFPENGYSSFNIRINPTTNKIVELKYYIYP